MEHHQSLGRFGISTMWFGLGVCVVFLGTCDSQLDSNGGNSYSVSAEDKSCDCPSMYGYLEDDLCECVPFYLCDNTTKAVVTDGKGIFDFKAQGGSRVCEDPDEFCCKVATAEQPKQPTKQPKQSTEPLLVWTPPPPVISMNRKEPLRKSPETPQPSGMQCGERTFKKFFVNKISGPSDDIWTTRGEFPWMLMLYTVEVGTEEHPLLPFFSCGASLIHPKVVLTAAQCVQSLPEDQIFARGGYWDTEEEEDRFVLDRKVEKVHIHEGFDDTIPVNDIALLELEEAFELGEFINTVCLPEQSETFHGQRCTVTGWGLSSDDEDAEEQQQLRQIKLPMLERADCEGKLKAEMKKNGVPVSAWGPWKLDRGFLCAGGEDRRDSCSGDGGGPLVCPDSKNKNRLIQTGIISWGLKTCGQLDVPGVYTDVGVYREWIDNIMSRIK